MLELKGVFQLLISLLLLMDFHLEFQGLLYLHLRFLLGLNPDPDMGLAVEVQKKISV